MPLYGPEFEPINRAYNTVFRPNRLSLGLVVPLETYSRGPAKPAMQSLYVDLAEDPETPPQPIHLGFRLGAIHLRAYLKSLEDIGINHVAMNLRLNQAETEITMKRLANEFLSEFPGPDYID